MLEMEKKFAMDLQLFADEPGGADDKGEPSGGKGEEGEKGKTYTDEQVQAMIQKEADRRVTEALKKKEEKTKTEIEEAKKEALELAKLSEKERLERERQKEIEEFQKEKAEFQKQKLKLEAQQDLTKKGLNPVYADFLISDNAESTLENINAFEKQYKQDLEDAVKEKLKGRTPDKPEGSGEYNPWSKATFNLTKQGEIMKEDPAKAERLKKSAIK